MDPYMFSVFNAETATKTPDLAVRPKQKPRADSVAILNMIFSAERSGFVEWHAPSGFTKGLLNFVVQLQRLSFRAGETSEHLAITDRGRLLRWNEAVDKALRGAGDTRLLMA